MNEVLADFQRMYGREPFPKAGLCYIDMNMYCPGKKYSDLKISLMFKDNGCEWIGSSFDYTNHRYANKDYRTLSQKSGRCVSRFGCYLELPLSDFNKIKTLIIGIGHSNDRSMIFQFPIRFFLTTEKRWAAFGGSFNPYCTHFSFLVRESRDTLWDGYRKSNAFYSYFYTTDKDEPFFESETKDLLIVSSQKGKVVTFANLIKIPGNEASEVMQTICVVPPMICAESQRFSEETACCG